MTATQAKERVYAHCPTPNPFTGASCKRRDCPSCGGPWARSVGAVSEHALTHLDGAVVMIAITPPGKNDGLPWGCTKEHRSRDGKSLPHNPGKFGCQAEHEAADRWAGERGKTVATNWKKLRDAARLATKRDGFPTAALVIERVYEPQKRGVPHLHVIAGARTPIEYAAANVFAAHLERLASRHNFGRVDRGKRTPDARCPIGNHKAATVAEIQACTCGYAHPKVSAQEARRYLVNYLTGRSKKKGSIRENISHPRMPRSLWWVTPALTSLSTYERIEGMRERLGVVGGTGVTMRRLRYVRWYFAALARRVPIFPRLFGQDMLDVALVCARLEPKKARAPGETDEQAVRRHVSNLRMMRLLQEPWGSAAQGSGRNPKIDLAEEPPPVVERDPWTQLAMDTYTAWRNASTPALVAVAA